MVDSKPVGYLRWQVPDSEEVEIAKLGDLPKDAVDIDVAIGVLEYLGRGIGIGG